MKKIEQKAEKPVKLNEVINVITHGPRGRVRVQLDFSACPTMTEQHTSHLSDINYLMERYKPDELAAYIAAKASGRSPILGHDFSQEPDFQGARNITYRLQQSFEALPEEVRMHFRNHLEFLKFIDNPANQAKMEQLGLMTKKEIAENTTPTPTTPTTQEEKKEKKE